MPIRRFRNRFRIASANGWRMNPSKGSYKPNGLPARMLDYFHANPKSEPTRGELAAMLQASPANVSMAFGKLKDEGILRARNVIQLVQTP